MTPTEVMEFVTAYVREHTRGPDGWPIAWVSFIFEQNGREPGTRVHGCSLHVDRDRCERGRASELGEQITAAFAVAFPTERGLLVIPVPMRRETHALAIVRRHFAEWAEREANLLQREGFDWARLGEIDVQHDWTLDYVVVEMYAIDSDDLRRAAALGETWLAQLVAELPEFAAIVHVSARQDPDLFRRLRASRQQLPE